MNVKEHTTLEIFSKTNQKKIIRTLLGRLQEELFRFTNKKISLKMISLERSSPVDNTQEEKNRIYVNLVDSSAHELLILSYSANLNTRLLDILYGGDGKLDDSYYEYSQLDIYVLKVFWMSVWDPIYQEIFPRKYITAQIQDIWDEDLLSKVYAQETFFINVRITLKLGKDSEELMLYLPSHLLYFLSYIRPLSAKIADEADEFLNSGKIREADVVENIQVNKFFRMEKMNLLELEKLKKGNRVKLNLVK